MAKIDIEDYLEKLDEPEDREAMANREYQRQIFEQYVTSGDNFLERRAQLLRDYKHRERADRAEGVTPEARSDRPRILRQGLPCSLLREKVSGLSRRT